MDRAEATGIGVAFAGHAALLAALSLGFASAIQPPMLSQPMEVSFVEDIGLQNSVPEPTVEPPAQSVAPEYGPPEEAAPQPSVAPPEPRPTPQPSTRAAPPEPAPPQAQAQQREDRPVVDHAVDQQDRGPGGLDVGDHQATLDGR